MERNRKIHTRRQAIGMDPMTGSQEAYLSTLPIELSLLTARILITLALVLLPAFNFGIIISWSLDKSVYEYNENIRVSATTAAWDGTSHHLHFYGDPASRSNGAPSSLSIVSWTASSGGIQMYNYLDQFGDVFWLGNGSGNTAWTVNLRSPAAPQGSVGVSRYLIGENHDVSSNPRLNFTVLPPMPSWLGPRKVVNAAGVERSVFREGQEFGWSYASQPDYPRWVHHFNLYQNGNLVGSNQYTPASYTTGTAQTWTYAWGVPPGYYTFEISIDGTDGPIKDQRTIQILSRVDTELTANPTSVPANNQSESTLTLTYGNEEGEPVVGHTLIFDTSRPGKDTFDTDTVVTDANGGARVHVKSGKRGTSTFTVYDDTDNRYLPVSATVDFTGNPVSTALTATPDRIAADGLATSSLQLTYGDNDLDPIRNHTVRFYSSRGAYDIFSSETDVTDEDGRAFTTVRSAYQGTSTITVFDETSNSQIPVTATVTFTGTSVTTSLIANPTYVLANNANYSTLSLTYGNSNGDPVAGRVVRFVSNRGSADTFSSEYATTDAGGTAQVTVRSGAAGSSTYTVVDTTTGNSLPVSATVQFYNPDVSSLIAIPNTVLADGSSTSTLRLTYFDAFGVAVANRTVEFSSSRGSTDTFSTYIATTNSQGVATVTVRSSTAGNSTYTVKDWVSGATIPVSASVTFQSLSQPVIGSVTTTYGADGPFCQDVNLSNTINVTIADWKGNPGRIEVTVNGQTRSSTASGNSASITYDTGTALTYTKAGVYNDVSIVAVNSAGNRSAPHVLHWMGVKLPDSLNKSRWKGGIGDNPKIKLGATQGGGWSFTVIVEWPLPTNAKATIASSAPFLGGTKWGEDMPKYAVEVTQTLNPVTYPNPHVQGTATIKASGTAKMSLWLMDVPWDIRGSVSGQYQFSPEWSLKDLTVAFGGDIGKNTPDLLPRIPDPYAQALSIVADLRGKFKLMGDTSIKFYDAASGFTYQGLDTTSKFEASLVLEFEDWVKKWADAGLAVGVDPSVRFQFPGSAANAANFAGIPFLNEFSVGFFFKGWVKIKPLFLDLNFDYDSKRYKYPGGGSRPGALAAGKGVVSQPDRAYLESGLYHRLFPSTSYPWMPGNGNRDDVVGNSVPNWDVEETQVVQNIFPSASPALAYKNGKAFIAYAYDRPGLPANQASEIRVLRQTATGWDDVQVTNDTALDGQPTIGIDGTGQLVLAWTRLHTVNANDTPQQRLNKCEIVCSKYDAGTGTWGPLTRLTTNSVPDLNPKIGRLSNGNLVLSWLRSPNSTFPYDPTDFTPPSTDIYVAQWDGSNFSNIEAAILQANTTDVVSIAGTPARIDLAYCRDFDGDKATNDYAAYYASGWFGSWSNPTRVLPEAAPQMGANVGVGPDGRATVYFAVKGPYGDVLTWVRSDGNRGNLPTGSSVSGLELLRRPGGEAWLSWTSSGANTSDLWTLSIDPTGAPVGLPIQLTNDDASERQVACALTNDGYPSAAYVKMNFERQDRIVYDGSTPVTIQANVPTTHDLFVLIHRPKPDLEVLPADIEFSLQTPTPGQSLDVVVKVRNLRSTRVSPKIAIYDGDPSSGGVLLDAKVSSPASFAAGEGAQATFTITVPNDGFSHNLFAKVDSDETILETTETNNTASRPLVSSDLSAEGPVVAGFPSSGRVELGMAIRNDSAIPVAGSVHWQLWLGPVGSGTLITEGDAAAPAPGAATPITYVWQPGQGVTGTKQLSFVVDSTQSVADSDRANNTSTGDVTLLADLAVQQGSPEIILNGPGTDAVRATIESLGFFGAVNIKVSVFDRDPTLSGAVELGTTTLPSLAQGANTLATIPLSSTPNGTLWIVVDPNKTIGDITRGNNTATLEVTVPSLSQLTVTPSTVVGGSPATGKVILSGPAPAAGATVALTTTSTKLQLPANVVVNAGATDAVFTVGSNAVTANTAEVFKATYRGVTRQTTLILTTAKMSTFTMTPSTIVGGLSSTGTVTLTAPAPAGGASVALVSGNVDITVPASVVVPEGQTTATFTAMSLHVSYARTRNLYATYGGVQKNATLTLLPTSDPISLTFSPSTVYCGQGTTGTVTLEGPSPSVGETISLQSGTAAIQVPANITIPGGATTGTFAATTSFVSTTVTRSVYASFNGTQVTGSLTLIPARKMTVNSVNPASGVSIGVTPDLGGQGTGTTSFERFYAPGTVVSFNLPGQIGTSLFDHLEANGVTFKGNLTMSADKVVTAVFVTGYYIQFSSTNPGSGVPITVWTADYYGRRDGTTFFNRIYKGGQTCSMTAPASAGGNWFDYWMLDGVRVAGNSRTLSVTMNGPHTVKAVYAPGKTLTIQSENPGTGVPITVWQADRNGLKDGPTEFSRIYTPGTDVPLTAPLIVGSSYFVRWNLNGSPWLATPSVTVPVSNDRTVRAVYAVGQLITVTSSQTGVPITAWIADKGGRSNGTTDFTRVYATGTEVSFTCPATAGGKAFQRWEKDGVAVPGTSRTVKFTATAATTVRAVYAP